MSGGTYEGEVQPIRGDEFLDRVLGWLAISCALPVFGFAVYRLFVPDKPHPHSSAVFIVQPDWAQPLRVLLIALALVGLFGCTKSTANGFKIAIALFAVRLIGALALYPYSGGPRFSGTEILFDLVVIGYAWARMRSIETK